jgi:Uncharacterized protein conserved in bacteria
MALTKFTNSYLLTNRAHPQQQSRNYIYPCPQGQLFYFTAPGQYNSNSAAYSADPSSPTNIVPPAFAAALTKDLQVAAANGCAQITVYVHGLGNYFSDTCNELGTYGTNLQAQGYNGLVIAFDWPSYGDVDSYFHYGLLPYSFPPTKLSGTIRDNINGSVKSFRTMMTILANICKQNNAKLNFICHSEGNYMLMLAMNGLDFTPTPFINQVLLLAADINTGALQVKSYSPPWSGQLSTLRPYMMGTTVYWSSQDDVLPTAEGWKSYHNPSFPNRLGLHGPASFNLNSDKSDQLLSNTYGLDCSLVVNRTVMNNNKVPPSITVHSGYFYIPQVLWDMGQALNGVAPGNIANRVSAGQPDGRAYVMKVAAGLAAGPLVPTNQSLEIEVPEGV